MSRVLSLGFSLLAIAAALFSQSGFGEDVFTFDQIRKWVQGGAVKSLEDLLSRFPPAYRKNYALMHTTRTSQQDASKTHPRVIAFGEDADLILTFNGDPAQKGYQSVEIIEFKPDAPEDGFKFRLLDFSKGAPDRIVNDHPTNCVTCHRGRPIWDGYPRWPGAFGIEHHGPLNKQAEDAEIRRFFASAPENSRYKFLTPITESYFFAEKNGDLSRALNLNNFMFVDATLSQHPDWEKVRLLVAKMATHYNSLEFANDETKAAEIARVLAEFKAAGYDIPAEEIQRRIATIAGSQAKYARSVVERAAETGFVFDKGLGVGDRFNRTQLAIVSALTERMNVPGPESWHMTFAGPGSSQASMEFSSGRGAFKDFGETVAARPLLKVPGCFKTARRNLQGLD